MRIGGHQRARLQNRSPAQVKAPVMEPPIAVPRAPRFKTKSYIPEESKDFKKTFGSSRGSTWGALSLVEDIFCID